MNSKTFLVNLVIGCILSVTGFAQQYKWRHLPNAGLPTEIRVEDLYFLNKDVGVLVGLNNSIFKTIDAGATWQEKDTFASGRSIEFLGDKLTGVIGGLQGKVSRTVDGGETWSDISLTIPNPTGFRHICGWAHFGDNFYGVGWYASPEAKFYKSTDKGVTWQTSVIDINLATNLVDVLFISADTGFVTGGHMLPNMPNASVILKTTDGGNTWSRVFYDATIGGKVWKIQRVTPDTFVGSIQPYYSDDIVMVRSVDGGNSWSIIHTGYNSFPSFIGTQFVGFINSSEGWIGGYYKGLIHTANAGATWDTVAFGENFNRFFIVDKYNAYAGGKKVYKLDDSLFNDLSVPATPFQHPHKLYPVSPNPASGRVKIEFDLSTTTNVCLEVASIVNKRVHNIINARLKPGHYTFYWNSDDLPAGLYMVWLGTDELPLVEKFMVVK